MTKKYYISKNDFIEQKQNEIVKIVDEIANNIDYDIEIIINKKRTLKQNKSLHLYYQLVAEALNEKGLTLSTLLENNQFDLIITPEIIKGIWKSIQKSMYKTISTKDLEKSQQIEKIYDVMNDFLSEKFEIYVEFPNKDNLKKEI